MINDTVEACTSCDVRLAEVTSSVRRKYFVWGEGDLLIRALELIFEGIDF